jgi:molecular chaperone IbpA
MRTAFDFSPYRRSTVGFDRLFDFLENRPAAPSRTITRPSTSRS